MKILSRIFFFYLVLIGAANAADSKCIVRRAAIDVGSGATRLKIAEVDVCLQNIVRIISEFQEKVDYKEDLSKNGEEFSPAVLTEGKKVFKSLKEKALAAGVKTSSIAGVATAAFRYAKNAQSFLNQIKKDFGINIAIITQEQEGIIGFYAAMSEDSSVPKDKMVVWDIGGGSMQITSYDGNKFVVYQGELASVSFKNQVLKEILKSDASTPNPMSLATQNKAIKLSKDFAVKNIPPSIKEKIVAVKGVVFGIGGVHGISVKDQTQVKDRFSRAHLTRALKAQAGKTDAEIGGKYASTDVTNLALVSGFMDALKISEVKILNVNNANGVLINPEFWER